MYQSWGHVYGGKIMHIDNVVHIGMDEEYFYIEVGVTLYCSTIKVSRDGIDLKIMVHEGRLSVVLITV